MARVLKECKTTGQGENLRPKFNFDPHLFATEPEGRAKRMEIVIEQYRADTPVCPYIGYRNFCFTFNCASYS